MGHRVRDPADGGAGLRLLLAGLQLALAEVPDPFGAAADVPEASIEHGEEDRLVHRVPEVLEEARVEVDEEERQAEAAQHAVVALEAVPDGRNGDGAEGERPRQELVLPDA